MIRQLCIYLGLVCILSNPLLGPAAAQTAEDLQRRSDQVPGVIGADDRRILADETAFQAVGRLNVAGSGFCTATLVAPDRVLTAAHCLFIKRTGARARPDRLHFLAGYRKGAYRAHRVAAAAVLHPDYAFDARRSLAGAAADIAVLTLETPIPAAEATPIPIAGGGPAPAPGAPLTTISYARDRPELPSIERGCAILGVERGAVLSDCDVNQGASGGPMLAQSGDGGWRLVAVTSGYGRKGAQQVTIAAAARPGMARGDFR